MRFQFKNTTRPSIIAKKMHEHLSAYGVALRHTERLDLVARMTGHRDWQELTRSCNDGQQSSDDDFCNTPTVEARHALQVEELTKIGLTRTAAETVTARLHATNFAPSTTVLWTVQDESIICKEGENFWWVGSTRDYGKMVESTIADKILETDPMASPYVSAGGTMADGNMSFECWRTTGAETMNEAKTKAEEDIKWTRRNNRENANLPRRKLPYEIASRMKGPWGDVLEAIDYGKGLIEVKCEIGNGLSMTPDLWNSLPEIFKGRRDINGRGWYQEDNDEYWLVAIGLPHMFAQSSVDNARNAMRIHHPETMDIIEGKTKPTTQNIKKANAWFTEKIVKWQIQNHDDPDENGMVRVTAKLGWNKQLAKPRLEDLMTKWTFIVPATQLADPSFVLDHEKHAMIATPPFLNFREI